MLDVVRYRRVDINAASPDALFRDAALLAPERNTEFLSECVRRFREVNFADQATGRVYLQLRSGAPVWTDPAGLQRALVDGDTRAGLNAASSRATGGLAASSEPREQVLDAERRHTVGQWGP
jgi:hypothetical protein